MEILQLPDQVRLLRAVLELTGAKKLTWDSEQASKYRFFAELTSFDLLIASADEDDLPPFELHVQETGTETDYQVIETYVVQPGQEASESQLLINRMLRELYTQVKKTVLHLEDLKQKLFDELNDLR